MIRMGDDEMTDDNENATVRWQYWHSLFKRNFFDNFIRKYY